MLILKKVSKSKCDLMLGRKWSLVVMEYAALSKNKDEKELYDKYQCHQGTIWQIPMSPKLTVKGCAYIHKYFTLNYKNQFELFTF